MPLWNLFRCWQVELLELKGATAVNSQWTALMGGEVMPNAKDLAAITSDARTVFATFPTP